jgi:hypothetical protein
MNRVRLDMFGRDWLEGAQSDMEGDFCRMDSGFLNLLE